MHAGITADGRDAGQELVRGRGGREPLELPGQIELQQLVLSLGLDARDVGSDISRRHDHLRGERLVVGIAGAVEVG